MFSSGGAHVKQYQLFTAGNCSVYLCSKEKSKSSGLPPPSQAAPLPPPIPGNHAPPLPPSSARPSFQRPPVPAAPPIPPGGAINEDLYDDPSMAAMDYEASVPGPPPLPDRGFVVPEQQNHGGFVPQESSDIYGRI